MQFFDSVVRAEPAAENCSPNSLVALDRIFVFYTGAPAADGISDISLVSSQDGIAWSSPQSIRDSGAATISVMSGTSPTSACWQGILYLFFVGNGGNGIFYTTSSDAGSTWGSVRPTILSPNPPISPGTSPSVVQFNGALFVFYTSKTQVWYTKTTDGQQWTPVSRVASQGMSAMGTANPYALVFYGRLYVFFTGSGADGIFYTWSSDGTEWSTTACAGIKTNPGAGVPPGGTSAVACVWGATLYVFYTVDGSVLSSLSTVDGQNWTSLQTVTADGTISWQGASPGAVAEFQMAHFLVWNNAGTIYSSEPAYYDLAYDSQICIRRAAAGIDVVIGVPPEVDSAFGQYLSGAATSQLPNLSEAATIHIAGITPPLVVPNTVPSSPQYLLVALPNGVASAGAGESDSARLRDGLTVLFLLIGTIASVYCLYGLSLLLQRRIPRNNVPLYAAIAFREISTRVPSSTSSDYGDDL